MKAALFVRMASWAIAGVLATITCSLAASSGDPAPQEPDIGAQVATPLDNGAPDAPIWVKGRTTERKHDRKNDMQHGRTEVSLGDYVILKLNAPLKTLLASERVNHRLGLYINDLFFKDIPPLAVPGREGAVMFHLVHTDDNREQWSVLFSNKAFRFGNTIVSCDSDPNDRINVTVGFQDGSQEGPSSTACLEYFPDKWGATGLILLAVVLAVATVWLAVKSSMIRDIGYPPPGKLGPYSLARFQMALWFVTIVFAVLFTFAVTGDISPIPQGALILMGIGAGTAVSAAAIDISGLPGSKADYLAAKELQPTLEDTIAKLKQQIAGLPATGPDNTSGAAPADLKQQLAMAVKAAAANAARVKAFEVPASRSFIKDILGDGNGVAFHRLQVFAWTMVFWIFFVTAIFHKITMIDFAVSQLALMGISGATYLGFKLQQQPKEAEPAPPDNAGTAGAPGAAGGAAPTS